MKGYCVDVRSFSEEKKKKVQDAFFKLGFSWKGPRIIFHPYVALSANVYTNVLKNGTPEENLKWQGESIGTSQKPYEITYEQLLKEAGMNIKPEDEVTITTTYGELLKTWAVLGDTNGKEYDGCIYSTAKEILNLTDNDHDDMIDLPSINYYGIQKELEAKVFGPKETEKERKVRELREQAEELMNKAKELEETIND